MIRVGSFRKKQKQRGRRSVAIGVSHAVVDERADSSMRDRMYSGMGVGIATLSSIHTMKAGAVQLGLEVCVLNGL